MHSREWARLRAPREQSELGPPSPGGAQRTSREVGSHAPALQKMALLCPSRDPRLASGVGGRFLSRGSPPLELLGQLIQDLHGLPVVVELCVHQGRELAHLLNLWASNRAEG